MKSDRKYAIDMRTLVEEWLDEHPPERLDPSTRLDPAQRLDPRFRFSTNYQAKTQLGLYLWKDLDRAVHRGDPTAVAFRNALTHMAWTVNDVVRQRYGEGSDPEPETVVEEVNDAQPTLGKRILAVLVSENNWDQAVGDLEEGYQQRLRSVGRGTAMAWYWWKILCEVLDGVPRRLEGLIKIIGIVGSIEKAIDWLHRHPR